MDTRTPDTADVRIDMPRSNYVVIATAGYLHPTREDLEAALEALDGLEQVLRCKDAETACLRGTCSGTHDNVRYVKLKHEIPPP